jgi:hypothetical protein
MNFNGEKSIIRKDLRWYGGCFYRLVNLRCTDSRTTFPFRHVVNKLAVFLGSCALLVSSASAQTVQLGQQTLPLPSSALWHGIIGDQPADNSVQGYNPPVFKWIYSETPQSTFLNFVRTFQFQLSTNASFSPLYWNIVCSNNFYNFVPPITNADGSAYAGTNYWRIVYMNADQSQTVGTGPVHTFTLAPGATLWDRSMLADTNYLMGIATNHPHMWFNAKNLSAMSSFLQTHPWPGQNWGSVTNTAGYFQSQSWWNNSSITNLGGSFLLAANGAQTVAFSYYMSGSNSMFDIKGAANTLDWFATTFLQQQKDMQDPYTVDPGGENSFATAYDWLYPFMTPAQRSHVLYALVSLTKFCAYSDGWAYISQPAVTNRIYTNSLQTPFYTAMKIGTSHERYDSAVGLECCIAAMGENSDLLGLFPMFMNYSFAQFDPYQGDEGRGYSEQDNFKYDRLFGASTLSTVQFPEAKLWMNPIYTNLGTFFANWEPVGWLSTLDPWGDLGYGFRSQWYNTRYFDLALLTQNGAILRQFNRSSLFRLSAPDNFALNGEAFLPYYFPTPVETDWADSSYLDVVRGWAISSSLRPTDWGAFTNGVGFVFQARPAGARLEHSSLTDGQVELWAYGANCTTGGAAGGYAKHSMYYDGLMVNGIGLMNAVSPPTDAYLSRIIAFTNAPSFTYVAADITKAFNRSNYNTGGLGNMNYPFYTYASNTVPYVSNIQRHVLFPHKKYLVLYDQMQTTQPATFQWIWHVFEPTAVFKAANGSLTYTCTNDYNGSNVTVYVQHIVNSSLLAFTNVVGASLSKFNPFTGENYFGKDNDTGPYYNSTLWAYNRTPTNNWHFMTVIYPVKWGDAPPTITRIDDSTVKVQKGGISDTISFSQAGYQPSISLQLQSGPAPPQNLRIGP